MKHRFRSISRCTVLVCFWCSHLDRRAWCLWLPRNLRETANFWGSVGSREALGAVDDSSFAAVNAMRKPGAGAPVGHLRLSFYCPSEREFNSVVGFANA